MLSGLRRWFAPAGKREDAPLLNEADAATLAAQISNKMTAYCHGQQNRRLLEKVGSYNHSGDSIEMQFQVLAPVIPWNTVMALAGTSPLVTIKSHIQQPIILVRVKKAALPSARRTFLKELCLMSTALVCLSVLRTALQVALPTWICSR